VFAADRLQEFRERITAVRRRTELIDPVWPRAGLLAGKRAMEFLRPFLPETIEEMPRAFAAVATDLRTGAEVVLGRGSVLDAVRASIAIPGLLAPVPWQGRLLVDGALANPLPVSVARALGADFVIAVNVISALTILPPSAPRPAGESLIRKLLGFSNGNGHSHAGSAPEAAPAADTDTETAAAESTADCGSLADVLSRASAVIQANIAAARLRNEPADFCIAPDVQCIGLFDFNRANDAIEAGRAAARAVLPALLERIAAWRPPSRPRRYWRSLMAHDDHRAVCGVAERAPARDGSAS